MYTGRGDADKHSSAPFWTTLIFGIPALVAYVSAVGLHSGTMLFLPGLWFVYSVSEEVAMFGVVLSLGVSIGAMVRHMLTGWMILLTLFSIVTAGLLIWHGAEIARLSL